MILQRRETFRLPERTAQMPLVGGPGRVEQRRGHPEGGVWVSPRALAPPVLSLCLSSHPSYISPMIYPYHGSVTSQPLSHSSVYVGIQELLIKGGTIPKIDTPNYSIGARSKDTREQEPGDAGIAHDREGR